MSDMVGDKPSFSDFSLIREQPVNVVCRVVDAVPLGGLAETTSFLSLSIALVLFLAFASLGKK